MAIVSSLLLLLLANGAPIIAAYLMKAKGAWQIDGGTLFIDREPLFGESKTWRGIIAAMLACGVMGVVLGYPGMLGVVFALYAMLGDLISSFIKRRLQIPASGRMTGLDQLPESLLPLLLLHQELGLGLIDIAMVVVAFLLLDEVLSRLLFHWHIRRRPY